jgi:hypothetical protein
MIDGMNNDQFKAVINFVRNYHQFGSWRSGKNRKLDKEKYPNLKEFGYSIKYVDTCYDSRTNTIWSITFRQGTNGINFRTNLFTDKDPEWFEFDTLYDLCMAYLTGEFKPEHDIFQHKASSDIDEGFYIAKNNFGTLGEPALPTLLVEGTSFENKIGHNFVSINELSKAHIFPSWVAAHHEFLTLHEEIRGDLMIVSNLYINKLKNEQNV